ncbi:hypothetical protein BGZ58_006255 [Dissophora ornata]|nr:hypothetical protein BGZ58_006255 [Dissophora ornata]
MKQSLASNSGGNHVANADAPSITIVPSSSSTESVSCAHSPSLPSLPSPFHNSVPAPDTVDAASGGCSDSFVNKNAPDVQKYAERGAGPVATTVVEVAEHEVANGADTTTAGDGKTEAEAEAEAEAHHTVAGVTDSVANLLPETVSIPDLPDYFLDDDFGGNAKRDEKYARIRLVALREHQQVLIRLLSEILEADNQYRHILHQSQNHHGHIQGQNQVQSHGHTSQRHSLIMSPSPSSSPRRSSTPSPYDKIQVQDFAVSLKTSQFLKHQCDCLARRTTRHQKRAAAVQGYQKAILDLWQTDQNMCHWLSRYIRTTRRVSRSLEFILVATRNDCMVRIGEGVSNPELERMGILQSKLLEYVVAPARSSMAFMSTTLPSIDDALRRSSAPTGMTQYSNDSKTIDVLSSSTTMSATANSTARHAPSRPLPATPASMHALPSRNDYATKTAFISATVVRSVTIPVLPPLSPLCPAPSTPPPAIPAPSPPGPRGAVTVVRYSSAPVTSRSQAPTPIATSNIFVQPQEPQQPQQRSTQILQLQSQPIISSRRLDGFQDYDDLEAAIFMGFHMQSVQKAKEFLNNFNKESFRSRIMVERFKVAREVYEHRALGQPWKMMQYAKEYKRKKRVL